MRSIDAASTKPFGFMAFYPGPGLGGHCIPIDPFYLSWKAKQSGFDPRFIELAGHINGAMPEYVVSKVGEALNTKRKAINGANVLIAGVAYSEDGHEQAGMGVGVADYDCDGWLDIFKTNFADDTCNLYHNSKDGTFSDVTFASGVGINNQYVAWGCGFANV